MCLAQGHNTVTPVRLEPAASWSRVKHSTTKPLHSLPRGLRIYEIQLYTVLATFGGKFLADVSSYCVHPGPVATDIFRLLPLLHAIIFKLFIQPTFKVRPSSYFLRLKLFTYQLWFY